MTYFNPIKTLRDINLNELTSAQALRIFTTKKQFAVLAFGKLHLTNDAKRLVMDRYRIDEAIDICIYDLTK